MNFPPVGVIIMEVRGRILTMKKVLEMFMML